MLEQGCNRNKMLFSELKKSVMRSNEMILNLLDFTKGRLDELFAAVLQRGIDMAELVEAIAAGMQIGSGQRIDVEVDRPLVVDCNAERIRQLVSNLVGNATQQGRKGAPIRVFARNEGGDFALIVVNEGDPIPPEVIPRIFAPFARGKGRHGPGLSLGPYIAQQIAERHGGEISVASDAEVMRVSFRMRARG